MSSALCMPNAVPILFLSALSDTITSLGAVLIPFPILSMILAPSIPVHVLATISTSL